MKDITLIMTIKPCDCIDQSRCDMLNEQGIGIGDNQILVEGGGVFIKNSTTTLRIPLKHFKRFAEWFLEEQEIKK